MRLLPTIKDSRGEESVTLTFVAIGWLMLTIKFTLGGLSLTVGTPPAAIITYSNPVISAGEYGAAFALIIGIWLGREYQEKRKPRKDGPT